MLLLKTFFSTLIFSSYLSKNAANNNVCSDLKDYALIQFSKNCWHNPDVGLSAKQIIQEHGYPFEVYEVLTEDGYKLGLFRIPNKGHPIFLQHGIAGTSLSFLSLGNNSLAFRLFDAGYDVWLGNFRGTVYSNQHSNSTISDEDYWNFSFYEMGFYDLPAMIEVVASKTSQQQKIIYIGHSMGTTTSFVYAITRKSHAESKLAALISLAPVVYLKYAYLPLANFAPISGQLQMIANLLNLHHFGMSNTEEERNRHEKCLQSFQQMRCDVMTYVTVALNLDSLPPESLPMFLTQAPAGTSVKTVRHYSQEIVAKGRFQFYDYENLNKEKYGTEKPPVFDVTQVELPVYLFYGKKDAIGDEKDVLKLYETLRTKKFIKKIPEHHGEEFNHLDFLYGKNVDYLYEPLFEIIKKIDSL